jgi:RNA polymerase sigma-70 factor, ECF subfamily
VSNGTPDAIPPPVEAADDETLLVRALRDRDEAAFARLLDEWYGSMLRIAMGHVGSRARAEEVVQETWLAVLSGIDRFEGRSSLRTWVFRILVNRARTMSVREARLVPLSTLAPAGDADDLSTFMNAGADASAPEVPWLPSAGNAGANPEDLLVASELGGRIEQAIDALPARQREVVVLRDVEGWSAPEVCNALGISETNQRVLLHRARAGVRTALAGYVSESGS